MADINFNTVSVASAVNNSDYLHITTGGTHRRLSVQTLINKAKSDTLSSVEAAMLDRLTSGCLIMYHRKLDNTAITCSASNWTALQNAGEIADGVLIVEGGRHLVVAPTQSATKLSWSSSDTAVGTIIADRIQALSDFNGKDNTAAALADATIGGDGDGFAPGFCAAYSRSNGVTYGDYKDNYGMYAGRWWLPSLGEMAMIASKTSIINACLSLISGAEQISNAYWTSTCGTSGYAWYFYLSFQTGYKSQSVGSYWVRPVSAFYM